MKKLVKYQIGLNKLTQLFEIYIAAKMLKWKKRLNPISNNIGFGIYFYKNLTINLNRLNKEMVEISKDCETYYDFSKAVFPTFISISDGIHASVFTKMPTHVIERITNMVTALPGYKAVQSASGTYGYKCEIRCNQDKMFIYTLQIHFKKNHTGLPMYM